MSATAYADNFTDLSGWTSVSGMTTASGEVKASADNAAVGKITRTHESVAGGSYTRMAFDFVVDTSMTAGTQVSVAILDSTSTFGQCVFIKQGVGIVSSEYNATPNYDQPTVLLAWASLVNGGRYHIEVSVNPASFNASYSLYDPSGNLVLRSATSNNSVFWFQSTRVVIESNSTKTTLSRFAIDPSLTGSVTTGKYFTNVVKFTFYLTATNVAVTISVPGTGVNPVDLYIPGGGNITDLMPYFHGAGQAVNFLEITAIPTGGWLIRAALYLGYMVVVPSIPAAAGGGDSWGNDFGAASVLAAVTLARTFIGNPNAPQHYLSYSMGTATAGRLIGNDGVTNVKSWYIRSGLCDLAHAEQNTFVTEVDAAWGVSHQADYATAQATFARGNPIGLLNTYPGRYAGVATFLEYSTTGDGTLPQANHCVAFDALLTAKNIAHKSSLKVFASHTEASTVGDAAAHLAQVTGANSGGSRPLGSMSLTLS